MIQKPSNTNPKIGIVTVLYNSETVLDGFYKSLDDQTYCNFVLYVIDNSSPDGSLKKAEELSSKASFESVIMPEKENWGIAKGNNIGIKRALEDKCDYILLANNDIEFGKDTISVVYDSLIKNHCQLIVPKILYHGTDKLWFGGGRFGYIYPTYHEGQKKTDSSKYNLSRIIEYAPTCFMLIDSKVFETTGLMDEKYFAYFDDTDFIWRATKLQSHKLYYEPKAVVEHKVGISSKGKLKKFAHYLSTRNTAYFMNKYFPWYRRWIVYAYQSSYYFLWNIKHPNNPHINKFIGYYREGIKMYKEGKRSKMW